MWIARDENGSLYIYDNKPVRRKGRFEDESDEYEEISEYYFPEVTWENSPKELVVKKEDV